VILLPFSSFATIDSHDERIHGRQHNPSREGSVTELFDRIAFSRGDGQDTINDSDPFPGSQDRASFGATINPLDLVISRQANNLRLTIHGLSDQIMVQNWYTNTSNRTEPNLSRQRPNAGQHPGRSVDPGDGRVHRTNGSHLESGDRSVSARGAGGKLAVAADAETTRQQHSRIVQTINVPRGYARLVSDEIDKIGQRDQRQATNPALAV
jgi:hypothetical protein